MFDFKKQILVIMLKIPWKEAENIARNKKRLQNLFTTRNKMTPFCNVSTKR